MTKVRARAFAAIAVVLAMVACSGGGKARSLDANAQVSPSLSSPGVPGARGSLTPSAAARQSPSKPGSLGSPSVSGGGPASFVAPVFSASEDRIGITGNAIKFCLHGPQKILPLVGVTSLDDLNVYWNVVNNAGGVHGRKVTVSFQDDQNTADGLKTAFANCRNDGAFSIISATPWVDILTAARAEAERTRSLYYFNVASETPERSYSYSPFISIEDAGRFGAQWILKAHAGKQIGIVTQRGSVYGKGRSPFQQTLAARGAKPAFAVQTEKDQGNYRDQIDELNGKADVVFVLDDPLASTAMIKQAAQIGYRPQWVLLEQFNLTTDTLGPDALGLRPIEALSLWPPYRSGDYGARYARYGDEVRKFEEAFQRYRGRPANSDAAWVFWAWWRVVDSALQQCGRDCTRNRFIATPKWNASPFSCPINFSRPQQNFGGQAISIARAYAPAPGLAAWAEVPGTVCRDRF